MINVHHFNSTSEAYDASQCNDSIKDGDVLVVPNEGIVGVLFEAWPVAVVFDTDPGAFHTLADNADITCLGKEEEKRMTITICPPDGEPYEQEEVFEAKPGKDYTASWQLAKDALTPAPTTKFKITVFIGGEAEGSGISVPGSNSGYSEALAVELNRVGHPGGMIEVDADALEDLAEWLDAMYFANCENPAGARSCATTAEKARAAAKQLRTPPVA